MLSKVREMIRVSPSAIADVIRFAVLTGLRPTEACESVRLLNSVDYSRRYYNPDRQCLEHFRFPQIFLRQTKKAYISFIMKEQLSGIAQIGCKTPSLNAITLACRRRGIKMEMYLTRKIFASWLIKSGIDSNTVDLLSGRVPQSVLVRHYQAPDSTLSTRVLTAMDSLSKQIES